jgi:hypothetical protein
MIRIKPVIPVEISCVCGGKFESSGFVWQGLHVCEKFVCIRCNTVRLDSLPINQAGIEQYTYYPDSDLIFDKEGNAVPENWFTLKLRCIAKPRNDIVDVEFEIIKKYDEVLILNTLDYIYGHSLLFLLNLQRIIRLRENTGIIVIVQPMLRWLVPKQDIAEIWTVKLGFQQFNNYYPDLSAKINEELNRFQKVWLSKGHLIPTNENIDIEKFTGITPYNFSNIASRPSVTFVWREDPDRLWIRNIYLLKGFKKLGLSWLLVPFQYLRVIIFFRLLKKKLGNEFIFSVAGLGKSGKFPSFINDRRVKSFNEESEKQLCIVYAESTLAVGVHGSSMLLPSAHSGMTISLMPSKRWGNYSEDILFSEDDIRLAFFQKRIIPLNICITDLCDIAADMLSGRDYFKRKFLHSDEL